MENTKDVRNSILVVDDEEMNLTALRGILTEDYDVRAAMSGAKALELAKADPPDLILLDAMMPGMDGYEVLAELKKDENTCEIPVVFITGIDSKEDEEKILALDAADYISKPLSAAAVKLRVKNQMQILSLMRAIEALSHPAPAHAAHDPATLAPATPAPATPAHAAPAHAAPNTAAPAPATPDPAAPTPAQTDGEQALQGRRIKIIHVDDIRYTLASLKGRLKEHFEIFSVSSHDQLFKLLAKVKPDILLLDVMMPEMDGFDIIRELKAHPDYKGIPVVFLTSINDEANVLKCKQLGAADVIIKPVPDSELITRINAICRFVDFL